MRRDLFLPAQARQVSENHKKYVVVLGSTGSIGESTLSVVRGLPDRLEVVGLGAGSRWQELARQIEEFEPAAAALADIRHRSCLEKACSGKDVKLFYGPEGMCELARMPQAQVVVCAVSGWAGFPAALAALECGRVLALANKESLVVGGELLMRLAKSRGGTILPVDSEPSAIMQAMRCGRRDEIARVIITASGGPFRGIPRKKLREVTPEQALQHPIWHMGKKVAIDSATLMNKALEIIETRWLFDLAPERIEVLIHPQCVIHSMVEFVDGSVIAQLAMPDMRLPIQCALTYPDRVEGPAARLDPAHMGGLELRKPSPDELLALQLGYEVARMGGTSGAALNAANEFAVESFLGGKLRFTDIVPLVRMVVERHRNINDPDIRQIEEADCRARGEAAKCLELL